MTEEQFKHHLIRDLYNNLEEIDLELKINDKMKELNPILYETIRRMIEDG